MTKLNWQKFPDEASEHAKIHTGDRQNGKRR